MPNFVFVSVEIEEETALFKARAETILTRDYMSSEESANEGGVPCLQAVGKDRGSRLDLRSNEKKAARQVAQNTVSTGL